MERTFESWIGHPVVLELALGRIGLNVSGIILEDRGHTLLMTQDTAGDVEIPRDYILKIERTQPLGTSNEQTCERVRSGHTPLNQRVGAYTYLSHTAGSRDVVAWMSSRSF